MVGVPRSKGCSTCRKRKIKCGGEKPSCLRCIGAKFCCPGYLKVLKFQDEGVKLRKSNYSIHGDVDNQHRAVWLRPAEITPRPPPGRSMCYRPIAKAQIRSMTTTPAERLAGQLCETFQPNLPNGKSLHIFGFVTAIHSYMGSSKALDISVVAICNAHRALLREDVQSLERSRTSYGRALVELRRNLAHGGYSSSETLCASALLGIYELLASTSDAAPIHHIGGASAILRMNGPGKLENELTCKMLKSLKGMIVIEAIILKKRCFLDSPEWKEVAESTSEQPFDSLFSILFKLPNILLSVQNETESPGKSNPVTVSTLKGATQLLNEIKTWRKTPAYQEMFEAISLPCSTDSLSIEISYTSNKAAALLCTYAAMSILLNGALSKLCDSETNTFQAESRIFAEQIYRSRSYSLGYAPLGNCYMNFASRVALEFQESDHP